MTTNQIRYLELQELQRANLAKEKENIRANQAKESETNRANLEAERLNREKLEYDKYGKDVIGNTIRTIKAGFNDVKESAADKPKATGYTDKSGNASSNGTLGTMDMGVGSHANDEFIRSIDGMTAAKAASTLKAIRNGEIKFATNKAKAQALTKLQKKIGGLQ